MEFFLLIFCVRSKECISVLGSVLLAYVRGRWNKGFKKQRNFTILKSGIRVQKVVSLWLDGQVALNGIKKVWFTMKKIVKLGWLPLLTWHYGTFHDHRIFWKMKHFANIPVPFILLKYCSLLHVQLYIPNTENFIFYGYSALKVKQKVEKSGFFRLLNTGKP